MTNLYFLYYKVNIGSSKEHDCVEGPYSLDELLRRRNEIVLAGAPF